jgi:hypothetical protein
MQYASIDMIVRKWLLDKGLPIHYYAEGMFHAVSAVRQLTIDSLQVINTKRLTLNSYNAVTLPSDFVDDISVTIPVGNLLHPLSKVDNINPLRNVSTTGAFVPYANSEAESGNFFGLNTNWLWFWNVNDYGEATGRYFGAGGGAAQNGYQVFKERREIQFTETFSTDEVVLLYISNGLDIDNASRIDWNAFDAIMAFVTWKSSRNADIKDAPEAATFYNEKRLLRARLNPLTAADIKNIIRKNFHAAPKN